MTTLLLALALLQEHDGPAAADRETRLRQQISDLERKLPALERRIRESVDQGDPEGARRFNQEYKDSEREIGRLRKELEAAKPVRREWYENFNLEAQALLTHWDNDLELEDGAGWGAALYLRDFLTVEYRRWDGEDELGDADATVQSYAAGFTHEFGLEETKTTAFVIGALAGLVRFSSDASGAGSDTGPLLSLRPMWKIYSSRSTRFNLGAVFDFLRTDFNQDRTHTVHDLTALGSIEFAF
jgi:hypothetical protein